jgi:hypothetical protein
MMWPNGGRPSSDEAEIQRETERQRRANPYLCIFADRWTSTGVCYSPPVTQEDGTGGLAGRSKGSRATGLRIACTSCKHSSKKCSHHLPACGLCVRQGKGDTCNYRQLPDGFQMELARKRVNKRHERIYVLKELTYQASLCLDIDNVGIPGTASSMPAGSGCIVM